MDIPSDHMWLKQSGQFVVNGQTRVWEIGIPVRIGASRDEIEKLIHEANSGMEQISSYFDKKIDEMGSSVKKHAAQPVPTAVHSSPALVKSQLSVKNETENVSESQENSGFGRKQFIAEIAMLSLNPRQAMEILNVRTLDGLNLQDSLEILRKEVLKNKKIPEENKQENKPANPVKGQSHSAKSETAVAGKGDSTPVLKESEAPYSENKTGVEGFFEEEDNDPVQNQTLSLSQTMRASTTSVSNISNLTSTLTPMQRVKIKAKIAEMQDIASSAGQPSTWQMDAYKNVVVDQLGEEQSSQLLQALWSVEKPDELSPDQIDACTRWAKISDEFLEEVAGVIELSSEME